MMTSDKKEGLYIEGFENTVKVSNRLDEEVDDNILF